MAGGGQQEVAKIVKAETARVKILDSSDRIMEFRVFPASPVVRTRRFHFCSRVSIPGRGTKILQEHRAAKKKKKKKLRCYNQQSGVAS